MQAAGSLFRTQRVHAAATHHTRCPISCKSLNRRDILASTTGLVISTAADRARADEQQQSHEASAAAPATEQQQAAAEAASSGQQSPAASTKKRKKRPLGSHAKGKPKAAAAKQPGSIPRVRLTKDLEISKVIRGCWQLDGQHKGDIISDRTSGTAAIQDLDAFCRHGMCAVDTADIYGPSEAIIGQHLRLNPAAAAHTKVLTKLSFMAPPDPADLRLDNIEYRVRSSAARLGVTSLDMVQLHWEPPMGPVSSNRLQGFVQAGRALQQLQQNGLIGAIGVSNFDQRMLMALLDADIKPVSNQVSYSVMDRRPALFLSRFCESRDIPLIAYGTLAGGFLADRYLDVPADKVRIDTVSKARYGTLLRQLGGWTWVQDLLQVLHDIGEKHGVSASCVAARWVLQQPGVAAIVLGARNALHIKDAQRLFSFELDESDMLDLDAVYEGAHQPTTDVYVWERGGSW